MKSNNVSNLFNHILFSSIIGICFILTIIFKLDILTLISCISSILYISFLSERNILNFIIGFISSTTYIIVAFNAKIYGEVIFYLLIDLPMIFISYFSWKNHLEDKRHVIPRKLSIKSTIIISIVSIISIILYSFILDAIGGVNTLIDATSTIVSFIATILMCLRYKEQWYMWLVVYIVSIIMWATTFDLLMLIMSISCLLSCFIGFINWKQEKKTIQN